MKHHCGLTCQEKLIQGSGQFLYAQQVMKKKRFTVCLSAMADGRKLKPYVVFKGVRPIAELKKVSGVVVHYLGMVG